MRKLENIPLQEIICSIRFKLLVDSDFKSLAGSLFKKLMDEYPNFEPLQGVGVSFNMNQGADGTVIPSQQIKNISKYKYASSDGQWNTIIDPECFMFVYRNNAQFPYSWDEFEKKLKASWEAVKGCLQIKYTDVYSLGLKYTNHVQLKRNQLVKNIINPDGQYIAKSCVANSLGFMSKNQVAVSSDNYITVTLATLQKSDNHRALLLDIENLKKTESSLSKYPTRIIRELHNKIEEIFFETISSSIKESIKNASKLQSK